MDTFRTPIKVSPSREKIRYTDGLLFLGSCFTGYIGSRLLDLHFNALVNPSGVLFNPSSIAHTLRRIHSGELYQENELGFYRDLWFSFDHHTSFSHPDKANCLEMINREAEKAQHHFANSRFLFVTFGTAWVYRLIETGKIVANCHKWPASHFNRILLFPDEIVREYTGLIGELRQQHPGLQVIFSVSPVRHLGDGMQENQLSKSILIQAVNELTSRIELCHYFPAYEIMMDDLRDYRFYEPDMVHPNNLAIDYIWKVFMETFMDKETISIAEEVDKLRKASLHQPVHPSGKEYQIFCESQLRNLSSLKLRYPFLDLSAEEIRFIERHSSH